LTTRRLTRSLLRNTCSTAVRGGVSQRHPAHRIPSRREGGRGSMITTIRQRLSARTDDGMGLIEVMVAMFLLAILALALLPLLVNGLQLAVTNTTLAAATQLANDRIRIAHAASPDCSDVVNAV